MLRYSNKSTANATLRHPFRRIEISTSMKGPARAGGRTGRAGSVSAGGWDMQRTMGKQAVEWLAAAAADPRSCKRQWDQGADAVLLEAGRLWDVLSVPEHLGLGALDLLRRARPRASGPVLVNCGARRVGFFLPPDPVTEWFGPGVRHVGRGAWVAVPPPYQSAGWRLEWLLPPDGTGALYDPAVVERALRAAGGARAARTRFSRSGAERRR